jgi:hypothetical protein
LPRLSNSTNGGAFIDAHVRNLFSIIEYSHTEASATRFSEASQLGDFFEQRRLGVSFGDHVN